MQQQETFGQSFLRQQPAHYSQYYVAYREVKEQFRREILQFFRSHGGRGEPPAFASDAFASDAFASDAGPGSTGGGTEGVMTHNNSTPGPRRTSGYDTGRNINTAFNSTMGTPTIIVPTGGSRDTTGRSDRRSQQQQLRELNLLTPGNGKTLLTNGKTLPLPGDSTNNSSKNGSSLPSFRGGSNRASQRSNRASLQLRLQRDRTDSFGEYGKFDESEPLFDNESNELLNRADEDQTPTPLGRITNTLPSISVVVPASDNSNSIDRFAINSVVPDADYPSGAVVEHFPPSGNSLVEPGENLLLNRAEQYHSDPKEEYPINPQNNKSKMRRVRAAELRKLELRFQERLTVELKKVNNFSVNKHDDIFLSLRTICQEIQDLSAERDHQEEEKDEDDSITKNKVAKSVNSKNTSKDSRSDEDHKTQENERPILAEGRSKGGESSKDSASRSKNNTSSIVSKNSTTSSIVSKKKMTKDYGREIRYLEKKIDSLANEIVHLDQFVRLNFMAFGKLTNKFDLTLKVSSGSIWFMNRLSSEPFCNISFDDILILLSLTYALKNTSVTNNNDIWKPPECFTRKTQKYWIPIHQVVKLKTLVLKHLPYLIFGASLTEQAEAFLQPFAKPINPTTVAGNYHQPGGGFIKTGTTTTSTTTPPNHAKFWTSRTNTNHTNTAGATNNTTTGSSNCLISKLRESQLISSVYFDSIYAESYRERIHRENGARLVRFRWYEENDGSPDKEIFIERKVHHECWSAELSTKERFALRQKDVLPFMQGDMNIEDHFKLLKAESATGTSNTFNYLRDLAYEVSDLIQTRKMTPMIRTSYYRCAFQLSNSNSLRVSLDTSMTLLNEFKKENTIIGNSHQ